MVNGSGLQARAMPAIPPGYVIPHAAVMVAGETEMLRRVVEIDEIARIVS